MQNLIPEFYSSGKEANRFSFILIPHQVNYLKWVVHHRRVSRAVYLRNLILADMKRNEKYHPKVKSVALARK